MNKIFFFFFTEASKNYCAVSLFSLHSVCITDNKFRCKCCCNNALNLTLDFLLCLMHTKHKTGGVVKKYNELVAVTQKYKLISDLFKYYPKEWPGEKGPNPQNNLNLVCCCQTKGQFYKTYLQHRHFMWSVLTLQSMNDSERHNLWRGKMLILH